MPITIQRSVILFFFFVQRWHCTAKPCTFELHMLYYNTLLLLHKTEKIKMVGTSREISSAMDENHDEY